MCCHGPVHRGRSRAPTAEILYQCHTRTYTYPHVQPQTLALCGLLQKSRVLQEPLRGEDRRMSSSDISISAIKDTTALKVSRCAVYMSPIKRVDLL